MIKHLGNKRFRVPKFQAAIYKRVFDIDFLKMLWNGEIF